MKEGKKLTRKGWTGTHITWKEFPKLLGSFGILTLEPIDCESTDWELFFEEECWNLADNMSVWGTTKHTSTEYLKMCRDLIVHKMIQKSAGSKFIDLQDAIEITNKKFGDL